VPVLAEWLGGGALFRVTFDRFLKPGAVHPQNFHMRKYQQHRIGQTAVASGKRVSGTTFYYGPADPGSTCDYDADPADVVSALEVPADPFVGFPLT
jgi:hypothetical protein